MIISDPYITHFYKLCDPLIRTSEAMSTSYLVYRLTTANQSMSHKKNFNVT